MRFFALILTFAACFISSGIAQYTIESQKVFGGDSFESPSKILQTADNGYLILSTSNSGISGNKTTLSYGVADFWVIKLGQNLEIEWQFSYGGNQSDLASDIIETTDGNFILIGSSLSGVSGNKTSGNNGAFDYWVIKIDSFGSVIWDNNYGGDSYDYAKRIVELNDGNFIVLGHSDSNLSGDKTENSRGYFDLWLLKIDTDGNILWDKTVGGSENDFATGLDLLTNGEVLLSSSSSSNISGDKTENNFSSQANSWVVKLNPQGDILWDRTYGGDSIELNPSICVVSDKIYMVSWSQSEFSGNKNSPNYGNYDYWLVKMDSSGTILWELNVGGGDYDVPTKVLHKDGKLYLLGNSDSNISFDKTENSRGETDMWVVCLDTLGNYVWQKTLGGNDLEYLEDILVLSNQNILFLGSSFSGISGDKSVNNFGVENIWLVELSNPLNITERNGISGFKVYPNPADNTVYINLNNATEYSGALEIYDQTGRLIQTLHKGSFAAGFQRYTLNVSELPSGIYHVSLTTHRGRVVQKLVVK